MRHTCHGCPDPAFCRQWRRAQARKRRHQFLHDAVYLLASIVLYVTAPLNPRAWRRHR